VQYINPNFVNTEGQYKYLRIGTSSDYFAGFLNNVSNPIYGNGNDFSIFTYNNRDITFSTGTGNVIFFPSEGGNVGIGTIDPSSILHLYQDNSYTSSGCGMVIEQKGVGDAKLQYLLTNAQRWVTGIDNSDGDKFKIGRGIDWLTGTDITIDVNGNVGIGITNPQAKLAVAGTILAQEVKVSTDATDWPDFVFADDYNLKSLSEVEAFIKEHKHLECIPSAKTMEEQGVNLAEMNKLLLQKVEELMLHLIEKDKEVSSIKEELKVIKELILNN
jgi:hypothetical protein